MRRVAAGRVAVGQVGRPDRRVARPQRVVVVCPEHGLPARGYRFEGVGRRPAAPSIRIPAVAREPRIGGQSIVRGAKECQPRIEGRRFAEVDVSRGERGLREMEVRVGQPGECHLVRLETDALGERVRPRLQEHLRTRERDAAIADPDRLDPTEAGITLQCGDPPCDEHVERHGGSAYRVGEQRGEVVAPEPSPEPKGQRDARLDGA